MVKTYGSNTVPIADPELARRGAGATDAPKEPLSETLEAERVEIQKIVDARERYGNDRKSKEREWTESFKMYMSWVDTTLNPWLSNLFIPKTHEAVELLSAFLIGTNQTVSATAENGSSDTMKARVAGKWLDYLWRKVLKARIKTLIWIKQGIVFGNGIMKFGWDPVAKKTWMSVPPIEDIYFDYFEPDIQESEYLVHEVRRLKIDVDKDEKYDIKDQDGNYIREQSIEGGTTSSFGETAMFSTFDGSMKRADCDGKVLVMEVWCKELNQLKTLIPTSLGWRLARISDNPNEFADGTPFRPFVKLRFKTSPVPNRAYDTGAVFPTIKIQKAFNDLMREYFDGVVEIGSPMWIKRRGARINPLELVRRPGGIITVSNIDKDLKREQPGTIDGTIPEMLNRLDREFQEASMIVNLVKGMSQSNTATGDALAQQNVQTLLDMLDQNIEDALSEAGQMILSISLSNTEGQQQLVMYEDEKMTATLDFDPKNIDGMHDIRIVPDRQDSTTKAGQNKALVDFVKIAAADGGTRAKYPTMMEKIYKRYLDNAGVGDTEYFFDESAGGMVGASAPASSPVPKESISIAYKDAPEDIKRQMEQAAGFQPSTAAPAPVVPGTPPAKVPAVVA